MIFLKLIRFDNWIKNLLIFFPLFFSGKFLDLNNIISTLIVFFGFSLIASSVYILNDIFDKDFDRIHPQKKGRPIASGQISIRSSVILMTLILIVGMILIGRQSYICLFYSLIYFALNILYSSILKKLPIIDFVIISIGFVLRLFIGGEISSTELSNWIIIMVFLVSIFIALCKRRDDVYNYESKNLVYRDVVKEYNLVYIDKCINIISSVLLVSYLLFITSPEILSKYNSPRLLIFSFMIVLIGILRFNHLTYVYKKSGSPIKIFFSDRYTQIIIIIWVVIYSYIIYF